MYYPGSSNPLTIIVMIALLCGGVLAAKTWLASQPDVVSEELASAEVVSFEKKQLSYRDRTGGTITNNIGVAQLQLEDGRVFTSTVTQPYPSPGDEMEVRLTKYSDGSMSAAAVAERY